MKEFLPNNRHLRFRFPSETPCPPEWFQAVHIIASGYRGTRDKPSAIVVNISVPKNIMYAKIAVTDTIMPMIPQILPVLEKVLCLPSFAWRKLELKHRATMPGIKLRVQMLAIPHTIEAIESPLLCGLLSITASGFCQK